MRTLEITIVEDKNWKQNKTNISPSSICPCFFLVAALGCAHRHSTALFSTQYVSKQHVITIQHHKQGHSNHFLCGSRTSHCDQLTLANMPWPSHHSHLSQPSHCSLHSQPSMAILPWSSHRTQLAMGHLAVRQSTQDNTTWKMLSTTIWYYFHCQKWK